MTTKPILGAVALVFTLAACQDDGQTQGESQGHGPGVIEEHSADDGDGPVFIVDQREYYTFDNLDDMIASADLVVEGLVTEVVPGRQLLRDEQFADATLKVEHVLAGQHPGATITIESEGWTPGGRPYVYIDGSRHSINKVGDHAIYALVLAKPDPDGTVRYRVINSQGKLDTTPAGNVVATARNDLQRRLAAMKADELRQEITRIAVRTHPNHGPRPF